MSSLTRAIILKNYTDIQCVKASLNMLGFNYMDNGINISLDNGINLINKNSEISISYLSDNQTHLKFISNFPKTYEKILAEKIEKMRIEEAKLREAAALNTFSEKERKEEEMRIHLERKKLEEIKRKEEKELKEKIAASVKNIKEKAEKFGFVVKEEIRGKEKILQLVRRV